MTCGVTIYSLHRQIWISLVTAKINKVSSSQANWYPKINIADSSGNKICKALYSPPEKQLRFKTLELCFQEEILKPTKFTKIKYSKMAIRDYLMVKILRIRKSRYWQIRALAQYFSENI